MSDSDNLTGTTQRSTKKGPTDLVFDRDDINAATGPMANILRQIFFRKKITMERFEILFNEQTCMRNQPPETIKGAFRQLCKILMERDDDNFLCGMALGIILYDILQVKSPVTLSITLESDDGEALLYATSIDPVTKKIRQLFGPH